MRPGSKQQLSMMKGTLRSREKRLNPSSSSPHKTEPARGKASVCVQSMHHLLYVTERGREAIGTDTETMEEGEGVRLKESHLRTQRCVWREREREERERERRERERERERRERERERERRREERERDREGRDRERESLMRITALQRVNVFMCDGDKRQARQKERGSNGSLLFEHQHTKKTRTGACTLHAPT